MKKLSRYFHLTVFVLYLFFLATVLFFRYGMQFDLSLITVKNRLDTSANLIPFHTVQNYFRALEFGNISPRLVFLNVIGNLVLFFPMGIYLPALTKIKGCVRVLSSLLLIIITVECIQLITGLGRFDVDDMILNFTGAVVGYLTYAVHKVKHSKQNKKVR